MSNRLGKTVESIGDTVGSLGSIGHSLGDSLGSSLGTSLSKARGNALGDFLKEQRVANRLSLRQLAEATGVSNPYLSQVERGLRKPSAEVLQSIAKALRLSAETVYVRAGILSPD